MKGYLEISAIYSSSRILEVILFYVSQMKRSELALNFFQFGEGFEASGKQVQTQWCSNPVPKYLFWVDNKDSSVTLAFLLTLHRYVLIVRILFCSLFCWLRKRLSLKKVSYLQSGRWFDVIPSSRLLISVYFYNMWHTTETLLSES